MAKKKNNNGLPEGWEWKKLLEVTNIDNQTVNAKKGITYNCVGLENIESNTGKLVAFTPQNGDSIKSSKVSFKKDMVLYGKLRPYLNKVWVAQFDGIATTEILPFTCNSSSILPKYLAAYFRSPEFLNNVNNNVSGARMPRATTKFFKQKVQIPLPPLQEQKRLVKKLDALFEGIDKAIDLVKSNLETIPQLKNSLLDQAFKGQLFGAATLKEFELKEIAHIKGGKRLPKGKKMQEEITPYPYIRVSDFTHSGTIDLSKIKYISKEIHNSIKRYTISHDDVYISIAGTIGKTGIIPKELEGANLTENAAKIVFKNPNTINKKYVYYYTLSLDFLKQIGLATNVVAMPKLAIKRLAKVTIPLPPLPEQQKIVKKLNELFQNLDQLEAANQAKLEHLEQLKKSLLDQAFKGKL